MSDQAQSVVLSRQPGLHLRPDDFTLREAERAAALREGEVRLRVRWLSIDPYQRGLLDQTPMFGRRVMVGDVMAGRGIGEVVESRSERFAPGDMALGETGWATEAVAGGDLLTQVNGTGDTLSHHLGALGVPGLTAFLGLAALGGVGPGDVLLVSSAAGAVGSIVVQLAKAHGAKVVGLTSGAVKTSLLLNQFKADGVIDRHQGLALPQALRQAAPEGLTCFFDNVGEQTLADGLAALRPRGRALLCGYISGYEAGAPVESVATLRLVMRQRLEIKGFLVHDHSVRFGEARSALETLWRAGRLNAVQTVVEGLGNAPAALCDLLAGRAAGKVVVRVSGSD
jgi:hypothetical protein